MDKSISIRKKTTLREAAPEDYSLKAHYHDQMQYAPGLRDLLKNARLKEYGTDSEVKSASDYSYSASSYAGDHFRLVGDAAGMYASSTDASLK
jgi:hypothetical protein